MGQYLRIQVLILTPRDGRVCRYERNVLAISSKNEYDPSIILKSQAVVGADRIVKRG